MHATINFDGASKGNPGRAGAGSIVTCDDSPVSWTVCTPFGRPATNNEAEYVGFLVGVKLAHKLGAKTVTIRGDSKLVVEQAKGAWKCREPRLQRLLAKAQRYLKDFTAVDIAWIPRESNTQADAASNMAIQD